MVKTKFFNIAGITINYEANLEWEKIQLNPAIQPFLSRGPGIDNFLLQRVFEMPDLSTINLGDAIYNNPPWAIYQNNITGSLYYKGILTEDGTGQLWTFAEFPADYTFGKIYSHPSQRDYYYSAGLHNLSGFSSDSIWLAQLLANRNGAIFHSSAAILNEIGLMFIGRSEAGKTTTFRMLKEARDADGYPVTVLCDETNAVRRLVDGWHVYGTWGHGDESEVSPASAPLRGIFILKQSSTNAIRPIDDRGVVVKYMLMTLFRPFMTAAWWKKMLEIINILVKEIPVYEMYFDKSGKIVEILDEYSKSL